MKKKKFKRPKRFERLNETEIYIMKQLGKGYPPAEIADKLGYLLPTIYKNVARTQEKLRVTSSTYRKLAFKLAADLM